MLRKRWLLGTVGGIAGFLLLLALVVPLLVKAQAIAWVESHTKRSLRVEAVRFNPLTLSLTVRGLGLSAPGGGPELLAFERLRVALSLRSLIERAPILRRIELTGPQLHLERTGPNRYNFDDLLALGRPDPAAPPQPEPQEPTRFSLNNIQIGGGRIVFVDGGVTPAKTHTVGDLVLNIPFIGNVPYQTDLFVTPELRASVNGTPLLFQGKLKPFRDGSETLFEINLLGLDLAAYAPYYPGELPLTLRRGTLDTALNLSYRTSSDRQPEVVLSGDAVLNDLALVLPDGAPFFRMKGLFATLDPSLPLAGTINLHSLYLRDPEFDLRRDRQGRWQLPALAGGAPAAAAARAPEEPPTAETRLTLRQLRLSGGALRLRDELPQPAFATTLSAITFGLRDFDSGSATPAALELALQSTLGESFNATAAVALKPLVARGQLALQQVQLRNYQPYLQQWLTAPVSGVVGVTARVDYDESGGVRLSETTLTVDQLQTRFAPEEGFRLRRFEASGCTADLPQQRFGIGQLLLADGELRFSRNTDGQWSPLALLRAPAQPASPPAAASAAPTFTLGRLDLSAWRIDFTDRSTPEPARLRLRDFNLSLSELRVPAATIAAASLSWRMGEQGRLVFSAAGRYQPLQLSGTLRLQRFPLPDFVPYLPPNLHLALADGTLDGQLRYRLGERDGALAGSVAGSLGVRNLYALDGIDADDLLRWESLQIDDLRANLRPLEVEIGAISLSGLTTRLQVDPQGRLNFGKVVAPPAGVAAADTAGAEPGAAPPAAAPPPKITVGAVTLQNGSIDFTDRQLTPHFHAAMTELGGRVSGLSSAADRRADLDLRGTLAGRSPLRISGQLNPLAENPFADIRLTFDDIELAPATPYAGKYAGYAIEQGKLFLDLRYRLEDRRIDSSNRIFVDQFDFGEKVESPDATGLPVRLAVALLKDRKGEIHLDIPVTGRSDDPEFRIGQVVWRILKNLVVKAATSPMALLSSMIGGGQEFTALVFVPGSSRLAAGEAEKLAGLGRLLLDRPALKLSVSGFADAELDPEGYRREQLQLKLSRAKYLALAKGGTLPAGATPETLAVAPEERSTWLKAAYAKEKFPKPRNILGIAKELPAAEMEKLILANVVVGPAELDQLAWERGASVVRELVEAGLPQERIFQKRAEGKPQGGDGGHHRVEFGLTAD